MIFILSNKEREDKYYEEKYRIGKELFEADMLVIVTPLYYYGMSAQMKTGRFVYEINHLPKWGIVGL